MLNLCLILTFDMPRNVHDTLLDGNRHCG